MISNILHIGFKEFNANFMLLDSKDKIWLISLIHNSKNLEYYKIFNNENIIVGIGSRSREQNRNEFSFLIMPAYRRSGYGRSFIEFIKYNYPNSCFIVSKFNTNSLNMFRGSLNGLSQNDYCLPSTYIYFP